MGDNDHLGGAGPASLSHSLSLSLSLTLLKALACRYMYVVSRGKKFATRKLSFLAIPSFSKLSSEDRWPSVRPSPRSSMDFLLPPPFFHDRARNQFPLVSTKKGERERERGEREKVWTRAKGTKEHNNKIFFREHILCLLPTLAANHHHL